MKINFKRLEIYEDIAHKQCYPQDARESLADLIYKVGTGIACHALAMKIYNSQDEEEYNEQECSIIKKVVEEYGTPVFIDAINQVLTTQNTK